MKKKFKYIFIFILGFSTTFFVVHADFFFSGSEVSFNNSGTKLTSTNVQAAVDELYGKCSNIAPSSECPEGYECTEFNRVTYNANGGAFTGNASTNEVYYNFVEGDIIEKISKTYNVDDTGARTSNMPKASSGITDTVTIEGADSLEVRITYQTYNSTYSYVYVLDAAGNTVSSKLYGKTITTTTVTVTGDTAKIYFYNKGTSSTTNNYYGYYAKIKGKKNNEYIKNMTITKEEGEYSEPTNSNDELTFAGWTVNEDGSGTVYASEQEVMNSLDTENRKVVLYAKYKSKYICKRATTLHTETCSQTGSFCYVDGYRSGGSQNTTTITYGSLGTSGSEPSPGDAFDCDVTGNGDWERFYYVSNYFDTSTQSFDNDYYVFIYYSNTTSGTASTDNVAWYSSSTSTSYGPTTARSQLPTTSGANAWRDDLLKTRTRNILRGTSVTSVTSTAKSNFSYSGYAARLLTMQELKSACPNASTIEGSMSSCNYIFERTKYANSSYATWGVWLESAYSSANAWFASSDTRRVNYRETSDSNSFGARPAIEISKDNVSY